MSGIGDEIAAVAAALIAAGVPATADPTAFWTAASSMGVAALVGPPGTAQLVNLNGVLRMELPVVLAARGPDPDAYERLYEALPTALQVLRPLEPAYAQRYTHGDASMAAYQITCSRDIKE